MSTVEDLDVEDIEETDLERFEENDQVEDGGGEDGPEEGENEAADSTKKSVKPKRTVRNPRPKLNAETLKGKRGLVALESYFERVKFKGRGHEEEDLSVILKTYEYWCHRLFPKYPFDECISKIESLGKKKPVVTFIKRLRADLPYDCGPEIVNENENSENEDMTNNGGNDDFDNLYHEEIQPPVEISEEQLERIRLNKERAERIRREKQRQERELSEASGSQNLCPSIQHGNNDFLFEEAVSQVEVLEAQVESDENPEESSHILQVGSHNELNDNQNISQVKLLNSEENAHKSSNDLQENCQNPQVETLSDLEKNSDSKNTAVCQVQNEQDVAANPLELPSTLLNKDNTVNPVIDNEIV